MSGHNRFQQTAQRVNSGRRVPVAVKRLMWERTERERLRYAMNKLDDDCYKTISRLDQQMASIKQEMDMTVNSRSLSLDDLEIPEKRPPVYGTEEFDHKRHIYEPLMNTKHIFKNKIAK